MFDHFDKRLKRDLKQIVDKRIEASEMSSGSLMRVRNSFLHLKVLADANSLTVNRGRRQRHLTQTTAIRSLVRRVSVSFFGTCLHTPPFFVVPSLLPDTDIVFPPARILQLLPH